MAAWLPHAARADAFIFAAALVLEFELGLSNE